MADVSAALHRDRTVLRMMAMRRTLFVVPLESAPVVHAAASLAIAARQWRQLAGWLAGPTDPPLTDVDLPTWVREVADAVVAVVERRGPCTAVDIAADEPRLRTSLLPVGTKAYDVARYITPHVLMGLGCEGRIVRGEPQGGWTSRRHRWEPARTWWPDGLPHLDEHAARAELVRRWLARFGPATVADVQWWTGWSLGETRTALAALDIAPVTLDDGPGIALADDLQLTDPVSPVARLLPALDPTPMGWKRRDWYFAVDPATLFDRFGNVGPTVWWNGTVIGGWATRADGAVVWKLLTDVGAEAAAAVAAEAGRLQDRLGGAVVVPSFRTPLEKSCRARDPVVRRGSGSTAPGAAAGYRPRVTTVPARGVNRQILALALPALGALVAEPLFLLADSAIVGHLGVAPLAGLALAATVLTTAVGLSVFLAYGATAAVARRVGAGDLRGALAAGVDGMWLALVLGGVLLVVLIAPTADVLVELLGGTGEVARQGAIYLRWSAFGLPPMLAGAGMHRGAARTAADACRRWSSPRSAQCSTSASICCWCTGSTWASPGPRSAPSSCST